VNSVLIYVHYMREKVRGLESYFEAVINTVSVRETPVHPSISTKGPVEGNEFDFLCFLDS
jgi:hypothetical protein